MNILSDTRGTFKFLNKEYQEVVFEDWNDIPEDFQFSHLIQFLPNIPPPVSYTHLTLPTIYSV